MLALKPGAPQIKCCWDWNGCGGECATRLVHGWQNATVEHGLGAEARLAHSPTGNHHSIGHRVTARGQYRGVN